MSIILRHKRFNHTRKRSVLQQGSFQDLFISSIATSGLQSNKHQLKQKHVSQECSLLNLRSSWNHHCWFHRPFAIVGTTTISQSLLASTSGNGRNGSQRQIYRRHTGMQSESPVILRLIGTVATLTQAHIILCQSAREGVQFKKIGNI